MDGPELWRWVWLGAAVVFGVGEMSSPGSFFLAPFALGAAAAAVLSFAGVGVAISWIVFILVSLGSFAALRPLARRLDAMSSDQPTGVGAGRLIGETAVVLTPIPPGPDGMGLVRVGREEWRAGSVDGKAIPADAVVNIAEVQGTRLVVYPSGPATALEPPRRSS